MAAGSTLYHFFVDVIGMTGSQPTAQDIAVFQEDGLEYLL